MTILNTAEQIALELSARVGEISIANGYNTDIGIKNYRGRLKIDQDDIPCCVVVEGADTIGKSTGLQNIQVFQEYVLGGYAFCDPDNPNDTAHKIIKDLKRAVRHGVARCAQSNTRGATSARARTVFRLSLR